MSACRKHISEPVRGYNPCVGCEVERLQAENAELRAALDATDKLASEAAQRNEDMGRVLINCREWVYPPEGNCKCDSCADAAALLSAIDAALAKQAKP